MFSAVGDNVAESAKILLAMSLTAFKIFQCGCHQRLKILSLVGSVTIHDNNAIEETMKMASYNKCSLFEHVVAGHVSTFSSMSQPDILPLRTCCCLCKYAVAGHVAAFLSMLQPDMLLPFRACCSQTCCLLFEHITAEHVATCSSILQPDLNMLQSGQNIQQPFSADKSLCSSGSY